MIVLAPWRWVPPEESPFGGHWAGHGPGVDLRRHSEMAAQGGVGGYGIFEVADDANIDGMVTFTGNVTRDRDAWQRTLGFRPEGDNVIDWTFDQLIRGADNSHADAPRPLRCIEPTRWELHLGGRHERLTGHLDRLRDAVYVRYDLDAILDQVESGDLPPNIHRKVLKAEADRLGIDWRTLRSKTARWRNETPLDPTTTISDPMNSGAYVDLTSYNGWEAPQSTYPFETGSGLLRIKGWDNRMFMSGYYNAWHGTPLSANNNQAELVGCNTANFSCGPVARGNGTSAGYVAYCQGGDLTLANSSPGFTPLATIAKASDPIRLRIKALGSTIQASDTASSWRLTVTDTSITTGLRVGVVTVAVSFYSGQFTTATDFEARDFLAPTVTSKTASGTIGAGGTVQMLATEEPTSWSLQGSPPTGVSINSSGLVEWTSATPLGTHSITVRATNSLGNGDGTLTLTILAAGGSPAALFTTGRRR